MDLTENLALKTILKTSRRTEKTWRSGFTLIEILIVMAIIALVVSLGLPAISRVTYQRLNSTTRRFVGLVRTIRNDAILLNNIYRLVLDLDKNTYWVESQRELKLLTASELQPAVQKKGSKAEPPPSNFSMAQKYSSKPVELPGGVAFEGVLSEKLGNKKQGLVYIHFFPSGFNEQVIIYLNKEGATVPGYSILVRPTLGRVELFRTRVTNFASSGEK